jgi:hypothetical protein
MLRIALARRARANHMVANNARSARLRDISGTRDPFESLFGMIAPTVDPSSADGVFVRSLFSSRRLRKGEFYQRAGEITTHGGFVVRGCLRTFAIDAEGTESIIYFSDEQSWVGGRDASRARSTRRPKNSTSISSSGIRQSQRAFRSGCWRRIWA